MFGLNERKHAFFFFFFFFPSLYVQACMSLRILHCYGDPLLLLLLLLVPFSETPLLCTPELLPFSEGEEREGLTGGHTHTRTVQSSDAEAIMSRVGFHVTQFTVRVWPLSVSSSVPCSRCHKYTLQSKRERK
jgi:hypothetical protein